MEEEGVGEAEEVEGDDHSDDTKEAFGGEGGRGGNRRRGGTLQLLIFLIKRDKAVLVAWDAVKLLSNSLL